MWKVVLVLFSLAVEVYPCYPTNPCYCFTSSCVQNVCRPAFKIHGSKGNGYGTGGNTCNVDEGPWDSVVESCNCSDGPDNSDCQLQFVDQKVSCKYNPTSACLLAVENWAKAYSTAFENDPECKWDPIYRASQETWKSCASVSDDSAFPDQQLLNPASNSSALNSREACGGRFDEGEKCVADSECNSYKCELDPIRYKGFRCEPCFGEKACHEPCQFNKECCSKKCACGSPSEPICC